MFDGFYRRVLLEYNRARLPGLFAALDRHAGKPGLSVHFTDKPYVKMNPNPGHRDPLGVYAFTEEDVRSGNLSDNSGYYRRPNAFVLAAREGANILDLGAMSEGDVRRTLEEMGIPGEVDGGIVSNWAFDELSEKGFYLKPGQHFWKIVGVEKSTIQKREPRLNHHGIWNSLFKRAGIDAVLDPGHGIIYDSEEGQIAFLNPKAYDVLEWVEDNPKTQVTRAIAKAFPDFRVREEYDGIQFKGDDATISLKLYSPDSASGYAVAIYGRELEGAGGTPFGTGSWHGNSYGNGWEARYRYTDDPQNTVKEIKNILALPAKEKEQSPKLGIKFAEEFGWRYDPDKPLKRRYNVGEFVVTLEVRMWDGNLVLSLTGLDRYKDAPGESPTSGQRQWGSKFHVSNSDNPVPIEGDFRGAVKKALDHLSTSYKPGYATDKWQAEREEKAVRDTVDRLRTRVFKV